MRQKDVYFIATEFIRCISMTQRAKLILRKALALNEADRASLAGLLIESLETDPEEGVDEAWAVEIERRAAEVDSGEIATIPWTEVRARLFKNERSTTNS